MPIFTRLHRHWTRIGIILHASEMASLDFFLVVTMFMWGLWWLAVVMPGFWHSPPLAVLQSLAPPWVWAGLHLGSALWRFYTFTSPYRRVHLRAIFGALVLRLFVVLVLLLANGLSAMNLSYSLFVVANIWLYLRIGRGAE